MDPNNGNGFVSPIEFEVFIGKYLPNFVNTLTGFKYHDRKIIKKKAWRDIKESMTKYEVTSTNLDHPTGKIYYTDFNYGFS